MKRAYITETAVINGLLNHYCYECDSPGVVVPGCSGCPVNRTVRELMWLKNKRWETERERHYAGKEKLT